MKYVEFGGGLGDVINQCYRFGGYHYLSKTTEKTIVLIFCHNKYSVEIFEQHQNRANFDIQYEGYPTFQQADVIRQRLHAKKHVRAATPGTPAPTDIVFHPTAADQEILKTLPHNFVSFQPFSGTSDRDIPLTQIQAIDEYLSTIKVPLVMIGRNYNRTHKTTVEGTDSKTIISTVDKLSVPGTIELVKRSRMFICGHSSMNILAWHNHVPNYLLVPQKIEDKWFRTDNEWNFGRNFAESRRDTFEQFNIKKIQELLGIKHD